MRSFFVIGAFWIMSSTLLAQTVINNTSTDSVTGVKTLDEFARYKLYPTKNMWIFLKLDTRNGRIRQVQWSLEDDARFETYLNLFPIVGIDEEVNGRFILYPTTNSFNFIMLDQINGKTYQVQWSQDPKERCVLPIE